MRPARTYAVVLGLNSTQMGMGRLHQCQTCLVNDTVRIRVYGGGEHAWKKD